MMNDVFLNQRKLACEEINKKYGLNISVEKRVDNVDNLNGGEDDVQSLERDTSNV